MIAPSCTRSEWLVQHGDIIRKHGKAREGLLDPFFMLRPSGSAEDVSRCSQSMCQKHLQETPLHAKDGSWLVRVRRVGLCGRSDSA